MRWLWILWSGYGLYIGYAVYDYVKGRHLVSDMSIYNAWFLKKIAIAAGILAASILLKSIGKITLAKWVAGIPLLIVGIPMAGAAIGMFLYWLAGMIGKQ